MRILGQLFVYADKLTLVIIMERQTSRLFSISLPSLLKFTLRNVIIVFAYSTYEKMYVCTDLVVYFYIFHVGA